MFRPYNRETMPESTDDHAILGHYVERASWHCTRALACVRQVQDPWARRLTPVQHRELRHAALQHVLKAHDLLRTVQDVDCNRQQRAIVASQLEQLDTVTAYVRRELQ